MLKDQSKTIHEGELEMEIAVYGDEGSLRHRLYLMPSGAERPALFDIAAEQGREIQKRLNLKLGEEGVPRETKIRITGDPESNRRVLYIGRGAWPGEVTFDVTRDEVDAMQTRWGAGAAQGRRDAGQVEA